MSVGEAVGGVAPRRRLPSGRRMFGAALALCVTTVAVVALAPTVAEAAFPGANGLIVFAGSGGSSQRFCGGGFQQGQLFAASDGGSSPFQLTCMPGRDDHPFVSPDGSEVVFSNIRSGGLSQLFTVSLASTGNRRFAHPTLVSASPSASDDDASWSPAGDSTIVFQRTMTDALPQLYLENVADPAAATPVFSSPTGFSDTDPVFDPSDPSLIAFVRPVGGHSHIFSYDMTTQVLTDLSAQGDGGGAGNDSKPDFSPGDAGGRIVFESDRACGYSQLYTMTVQGTDQTPVFPTTSHQTPSGTQACSSEGADPVYSPQGNQLAFDRQGYFWGGHGVGEHLSWRGGSGGVSIVSIDSSGAAVGTTTGIGYDGSSGDQPNWGPSQSPPAQTPEAAFPILLPLLAAGVAGAVLFIRRRRTARRSAR